MITVLAMGWNQRKVESLQKTLAKRCVKARRLYCMLTFKFVIPWLLLVVFSTTEMSWLSRAIHLITFSIIFVAMLLRIFLCPFESIGECLLLQCLCLTCLSELVFFECLFFVCYMSPLDYFRVLI